MDTLTCEVTTDAAVAAGTLLSSESQVLMWKAELPGAQQLDMRDHPNDGWHIHCLPQMPGIKGRSSRGHSTLFKEDRAVLLNLFHIPEETGTDTMGSMSRAGVSCSFCGRG